MTHLDVAGASLYYETDGHIGKPALLLIHAGIANLRMWDPQVEALALDHFVIRFDTRGYGETETQNVEFSNRADVASLLDHLGVPSATLIGCSRGGGIAIDFALDSPTRVTGLITVGSGPSGYPQTELTEREEELFAGVDAAYEEGDIDGAFRLEAELWDVGPTREVADVDPAFLQTAYELNLANTGHVLERPIPLALEPSAYGRLGELAIPALVVVGDRDISVAQQQQQYLASAIPNAEGVVIADTAHLPNVERPAEFTSMLVEWLGRHGL